MRSSIKNYLNASLVLFGYFMRLNDESSLLNLIYTKITAYHFGILNTSSLLQLLCEKRIKILLISCQTCNYEQKRYPQHKTQYETIWTRFSIHSATAFTWKPLISFSKTPTQMLNWTLNRSLYGHLIFFH